MTPTARQIAHPPHLSVHFLNITAIDRLSVNSEWAEAIIDKYKPSGQTDLPSVDFVYQEEAAREAAENIAELNTLITTLNNIRYNVNVLNQSYMRRYYISVRERCELLVSMLESNVYAHDTAAGLKRIYHEVVKTDYVPTEGETFRSRLLEIMKMSERSETSYRIVSQAVKMMDAPAGQAPANHRMHHRMGNAYAGRFEDRTGAAPARYIAGRVGEISARDAAGSMSRTTAGYSAGSTDEASAGHLMGSMDEASAGYPAGSTDGASAGYLTGSMDDVAAQYPESDIEYEKPQSSDANDAERPRLQQRMPMVRDMSFASEWVSQAAKRFFWRVQRATQVEKNIILRSANETSLISLEKKLRVMNDARFRTFTDEITQRTRERMEIVASQTFQERRLLTSGIVKKADTSGRYAYSQENVSRVEHGLPAEIISALSVIKKSSSDDAADGVAEDIRDEAIENAPGSAAEYDADYAAEHDAQNDYVGRDVILAYLKDADGQDANEQDPERNAVMKYVTTALGDLNIIDQNQSIIESIAQHVIDMPITQWNEFSDELLSKASEQPQAHRLLNTYLEEVRRIRGTDVSREEQVYSDKTSPDLASADAAAGVASGSDAADEVRARNIRMSAEKTAFIRALTDIHSDGVDAMLTVERELLCSRYFDDTDTKEELAEIDNLASVPQFTYKNEDVISRLEKLSPQEWKLFTETLRSGATRLETEMPGAEISGSEMSENEASEAELPEADLTYNIENSFAQIVRDMRAQTDVRRYVYAGERSVYRSPYNRFVLSETLSHAADQAAAGGNSSSLKPSRPGANDGFTQETREIAQATLEMLRSDRVGVIRNSAVTGSRGGEMTGDVVSPVDMIRAPRTIRPDNMTQAPGAARSSNTVRIIGMGRPLDTVNTTGAARSENTVYISDNVRNVYTANESQYTDAYMTVDGLRVSYRADSDMNGNAAGAELTYGMETGYGTQPVYGTETGYGTQPVYGTETGYGTQPVYGTETGYGTQPVYGTETVYSTRPAYEMDTAYATRPAYEAGAVSETQRLHEDQPAYASRPAYETQPADEDYTTPQIVVNNPARARNGEEADTAASRSTETVRRVQETVNDIEFVTKTQTTQEHVIHETRTDLKSAMDELGRHQTEIDKLKTSGKRLERFADTMTKASIRNDVMQEISSKLRMERLRNGL